MVPKKVLEETGSELWRHKEGSLMPTEWSAARGWLECSMAAAAALGLCGAGVLSFAQPKWVSGKQSG